jgi:hypothetical protein
MTSVQPVYPNGIFTWTDRVNNVSVDFANDINSTVSDLISVEKTLGTNPQNETGLPSGLSGKVAYSTVSARISDAMTNNQLPYGSVVSTTNTVANNNGGQLNNYIQEWDPGNLWNGTDITIPCDGWYSVVSTQKWPWWSEGYSYHAFYVNGTSNLLGDDLIDWGFSGNATITPTFGPNLPRWQQFGKRSRVTHIPWQGRLHKGDRISTTSENGTTNSVVSLIYITLRIHMVRTID